MADTWSYVRWPKECCSVIGRGTRAWLYILAAHMVWGHSLYDPQSVCRLPFLRSLLIFAAYCSRLGYSILKPLLIVTVLDT